MLLASWNKSDENKMRPGLACVSFTQNRLLHSRRGTRKKKKKKEGKEEEKRKKESNTRGAF